MPEGIPPNLFLLSAAAVVGAVAAAATVSVAAYQGQDEQGEQNQPQSLVLKNFANASHIPSSLSFHSMAGFSPAEAVVAASDTIV
jgi:hypothetical protein